MADGEKSSKGVFIVDDEAPLRRILTRFLGRTYENIHGIDPSNLEISAVIALLKDRLTKGSLQLLDGQYRDGEAGDIIAG